MSRSSYSVSLPIIVRTVFFRIRITNLEVHKYWPWQLWVVGLTQKSIAKQNKEIYVQCIVYRVYT